jgi:hypothetical protein
VRSALPLPTCEEMSKRDGEDVEVFEWSPLRVGSCAEGGNPYEVYFNPLDERRPLRVDRELRCERGAVE